VGKDYLAVSTVINTVAELKPENQRLDKSLRHHVSTVINTVAELKRQMGGEVRDMGEGFHGDKHRGRIEASQ